MSPPAKPLTDFWDARLAALTADMPSALVAYWATLPESTRLRLAGYYRPYKLAANPPGKPGLLTIAEITRIVSDWKNGKTSPDDDLPEVCT
jgi:hypothetical protein